MTIAARYMDGRVLADGLRTLFGAGAEPVDVEVVAREPNPLASTFVSEIVTCRVGTWGLRRLFVKYQWHDVGADRGHRGGVTREAAVYGEVLATLPLPRAAYHGVIPAADGAGPALVIDHLDGAARMNLTADAEHWLLEAVRWTGEFHRMTREAPSGRDWSFLPRHDAAYYRDWLRRAAERVAPRADAPSLRPLFRGADGIVRRLLDGSPTVVHGELYPGNVLATGFGVVPIDWESAAIASGEIDFVTLTDGWRPALVEEAARVYARARWVAGDAPGDLAERFDAARVYWACRWLAEPAAWAETRRARRWRDELVTQLRGAGSRLGVVG